MLRETTSAGWIRAGFLNKRHSFSDGKKRSTLRYTTPELEALLFEMLDTPVLYLAYEERQYWITKKRTHAYRYENQELIARNATIQNTKSHMESALGVIWRSLSGLRLEVRLA